MTIQQLNLLLTDQLIPSYQSQKHLAERMTLNLAISECVTAIQRQENLLRQLKKNQ
jgi:hypothetical protein